MVSYPTLGATGTPLESPDPNPRSHGHPNVIPDAQHVFSVQTHNLVGDVMSSTSGLAEAQHTVTAPLYTPEVMTTMTPPAPTAFHATAKRLQDNPSSVQFDGRDLAKGTAKTFAGFGVAGAAISAGTTLALGEGATLAALVAVPAAVQTGIAGGGAYLFGSMFDAILPRRDGQKRGMLKRLAYGSFAPITLQGMAEKLVDSHMRFPQAIEYLQ